MRLRTWTLPRTGSRLFLAYALASIVPVLALGAMLLHGYQREARDRALSQAGAQAGVIEQMAIAPVLDGRDLDRGLRRAERDGLFEATELAIFSGSVVRLRVRTFSGRVVFSDDETTAGALPASHPDFLEAVTGRQAVALVTGDEATGGDVLRALQPIVPNATGQATGVLEVYLPYAPIAADVQAHLRDTSLRMAFALAVLYLVLGLISWSTTRRLRRYAAEREHEALHDPLTGLPNRVWFRRRASEALAAGADARGAVVLVDLDRFKDVNDTLGHRAGDELLRVVATRLRNGLRGSDAVARLGGDEFGLVLAGAGEQDVRRLVERLDALLGEELDLDGVPVAMEASFGIALFPDHGTSGEELLHHADAAMYRGKRGTENIVVFSADGADDARARALLLHGELRHALERGELRLHHQPKLALGTGAVEGVEALLRWEHPERGLLGPGMFLPAVEHSTLIGPLTAWVVDQALRDRAAWVAAGATWPISVNVSARNLEAPGFAASVLDALAAAGAAPEDLCVEVTETAVASDAAVARAAVERLAEAGVRISVDDFGMGFASLAQLRTLPAAELKIDRTFVAGVAGSAEDRSIVRSTIDLGHALGCSVTAEGVEDAGTAAWLREAGCDAAQGYHFARPTALDELVARFAPTALALDPIAP